jgi:polyhydroxybutyrate depolymerase
MKISSFYKSLILIVLLVMVSGSTFARNDLGPNGQNPGSTIKYEFQHDKLTRTFNLYLPKGFDEHNSHALLIALHGGGGEADKWPAYTNNGFEKLADRDQFLLVYPDGIENQWNDKRNVQRFTAQRNNVNDLGFISVLIDYFLANYPVDKNSIYVTGASNGGMMSNYVGELSYKVAAIAPVIASIPDNLIVSLDPISPISVLMINGTDDPLVRWEGGKIKLGKKENGSVIPVEEMVQFWVKHNKVNPEPIVTTLPDKDPHDGTRVTKALYTGGLNNTEVALYTIEGGGHAWPAYKDRRGFFLKLIVDGVVGRKSRDVDACEVIWDFFKNHSRQKK